MVRNGEVIAEGSVLIDPETYFNGYNTMINGIDAEAVRGAPTFGQLWPTITELLDNLVAAHNASFDMGFITEHAARLGLRAPRTA